MIAVLPQLSVKKEKMLQEDLEAYIFLSGDKLLCSLTATTRLFDSNFNLKKNSLFLKTLLICPSPPGNFAENRVLKLVELFAVFGKAFRIAAQGWSSMASGWLHEGLLHCRHCNLVVRLSLHLKIMPLPLLILIVANNSCLFINVIV